MFCETRWVDKSIVLEDFHKMYEPFLQCLESITTTDGWDGNSVIQASELLKSIASSTFIAAFHTIKYFLWVHRLRQGSECDILIAFQNIGSVKQIPLNVRSNIDETFTSIYVSMADMARLAGLESLALPFKCGRQTTRNSVPASRPMNILKDQVSYHF